MNHRSWLEGWCEWGRGVLHGMICYDALVMFRKQRGEMEHLFVLIVFGDLIGLPVIPPYYTLRLLPYVVRAIPGWRRRILRERDLTDLAGGG